MATPWLSLDRVGAAVSDASLPESSPFGMATMVSPTTAVTTARYVSRAPLTLTFFPGREQVPAEIVRIDRQRNLALLSVAPRDIPEVPFLPAVGDAKVQTYMLFEPDRPVYVEGRVVGQRSLVIDLMPSIKPVGAGAPVAFEQYLAGIVGGYAGEGAWDFISAAELQEWLGRTPAAIEPADDFDGRLVFARLTAGALRALGYAAGAAGSGFVELQHLYGGLYENYAGTTRRLFRAREVEMEALEAAPVALTELPPFSDAARRAVAAAVRLADARGDRQIRGRHLLYGALTVSPLGRCTPADVQLDDPRSVVGHRADTIDGEDLLDIKREARVLAGVLGAASVEPPISLGLFGEWGSGKSFFMRELERQFTEVEGQAGYCRNIVQIWFNAWHYIDTPNLWASLAAEIFERLDFELTKREEGWSGDEATRASALAKSAKARSDLASVTAERTQLESKLQQVESGLAELEDERAVAALTGARSIFNASVDVAKEKLQLDENAVAAIRETTSRTRALFLAAKRLPRLSWLLILLFALLMPWAKQLAATGAIGIALTTLVTLLTPAGRAVQTLYEAWQKKNALIQSEREKLQKPLIARKDQLAEELAKKKAEEEKKTADLQQHEAAVAALEPRRQMSNFIRERKASTVYTSRLGVIATAHDDFAELSRLLKRATGDAPAPAVDRIVLYIDDLDRCPEDKVVDVLQAVHLLLAFPLFIVVVGVDSRWLLHSLQRHLKQFDASDALTKELWASTPLNYLEKIFQIPFTIRRMRAGAFGDLIDNLARTSEPPPAPQAKPERPRESAAPPPAPATPGPAPAPAAAPQPQTELKAATAAKPAETPDVDYLTLQKWETDDMKVMYPLIPSPRAAKRFVNTYRLLRGMVDEYEQAAFVGDGAAVAGDYRAALLMLAMLTGYPEETTEILRALLTAAAPDPDWWAFAGAQAKDDTLRGHLAAIKGELGAVPPSGTFAKWAPHVARFSFHSGRVVSAGPILAAT